MTRADHVAWWAWLIPLAAASPWIVGIAVYWRRAKPLDGSIPQSMGELLRKRLWTR